MTFSTQSPGTCQASASTGKRSPRIEGLIDLTVDAARCARWKWGRERYGDVFVGRDPLVELDEELLDAMNYCEEAARRGYNMDGVMEDLYRLCERVRGIYRGRRGGIGMDALSE